MSRGEFYVGMKGPGATITYAIDAPSDVDLSAAAELGWSVGFVGGPTLDAGWVFSSVTATSARASYVPDGSEFGSARGGTVVALVLTVDGVEYRYASQTEHVREAP